MISNGEQLISKTVHFTNSDALIALFGDSCEKKKRRNASKFWNVGIIHACASIFQCPQDHPSRRAVGADETNGLTPYSYTSFGCS